MTVSGVPLVLTRPVNSMSVVVSGVGGTKKSALLTPLPSAVVTEIRPDAVSGGTVVLMDVAVEELTRPLVTLNLRAFLLGVVSKLVPLTVTEVPAAPIVGEKPVTVGLPIADPVVTVKEALLDADPDGAVIPIGPVVAPEDTVATICVGAADSTVAGVPLNVTVFWLGVWLKPVPEIVTVVPTGPLLGVNSMTDVCAELFRVMPSRFPTASYEYVAVCPETSITALSRESAS